MSDPGHPEVILDEGRVQDEIAMPMDPVFTQIDSARLRLVPICAADAQAMYPGLKNPRLYDFIPGDPPDSVDSLAARYARLAGGRSPDGSERWYNWVVRDVAHDEPLGFVQATAGVAEGASCLLAYVILEQAWGRGIGREAIGALVEHLRHRLGPLSFRALIDTRNTRSIRLVEALGFRRVATHLAADHFKGAQSDEHEYALHPDASHPT
jgi:RimJ/RimL family protein N-acetyltransferase